MEQYSAPKITIDLKEYNDLLALQERIDANPYKKALETLLGRLVTMRDPANPIYSHIRESFKINGVDGEFDGITYKLF